MKKTLTPERAADQLEQVFQKISRKHPQKATAARVFSEKLGLDFAFPAGTGGSSFHIASVGKLFTTVLVQRLVERGALKLNDFIQPFFTSGELENLFVYRGTDYASQVTVAHLLEHTSGAADYFEDRTTSGKLFIDDVVNNPGTRWTPHALLDYSRSHQRALSAPGGKFHYSDTGFILLGLLIEKVTGKAFDRCLADEIFTPLGMDDSYLMFYDDPAHTRPPIENIWFNKTEISKFESLSCDWSGGGIISTTADLIKFSQALHCGQLLRPETLRGMQPFSNRFRPGIYYGTGMMEIRFKDFFFLLGGLPKVRGHIDILATHLFYDPVHEAHIAMNFGSNTRMVESFQTLIAIENTLQKVQVG